MSRDESRSLAMLLGTAGGSLAAAAIAVELLQDVAGSVRLERPSVAVVVTFFVGGTAGAIVSVIAAFDAEGAS